MQVNTNNGLNNRGPWSGPIELHTGKVEIMRDKKSGMGLLPGLFLALLFSFGNLYGQEVFRDSRAGINDRVNDLLRKLTLEEKISLLGHENPAISRLGIKAYNWWNEGLHGVARAGEATVFPQAIGMAASFNDSLIRVVGDVISTEARAKYNLASGAGHQVQYTGLTFWSPNINIFRDPRWGRGPETYGEDPFLTASIGTAFVNGIQGRDGRYLKAAACAKHFAVHSGPEAERSRFNAVVDEKDLRETYLYAFNQLVGAGVTTVMCAYNSINGEPCCTGIKGLQTILRNEWHFEGQVVTDCGALNNIAGNKAAKLSRAAVAAAAVKAAVNLECGDMLQNDLMDALKQHLISGPEIDSALTADLRLQIRLGFFDDPANVPYSGYGSDSIHNPSHVSLARRVAQESMVLLKNNGILPLEKNKYPSIMVLGANASSLDVLMGSYHGISGNMVSFAEGIARACGPAIAVQYDQGYDNKDTAHFGGIWAAGMADLIIAVMGLSPVLEGEQGDAFLSETEGDRTSMSLPVSQMIYLKKLRKATKKPIVVVITAGSAIDIASIESYADAIVLAWYSGEQGGNALADVLFGDYSPSGRLPVTIYQSISQVPAYNDYNMKNRTYRYFAGPVQFPFGFGLSYTSFAYAWKSEPKTSYTGGDTIHFSVTVKNKGVFDAAELVQAYIQYPNLPRMPLKELKGFKKIFIEKGNEKTISLSIPVRELQKWDLPTHQWRLYPGEYGLIIGKNAGEKLLKSKINIR